MHLHHPGLVERQLHDAATGLDVPYVVVYPTSHATKEYVVGPYVLPVAVDAPVARGHFPLVVFSHGNGGWHLLYRELALHLAGRGYIVAMPEHPGNNRRDNTLTGSYLNLANRPRHLHMVIDAVLEDAHFAAHVDAKRIVAAGHSLGGYTALALAGGKPWSEQGLPVTVEADARIRALVLLAPAAAYYMVPGSLHGVTQPILMLTAEHDFITPDWQASLVQNGVPDSSRVTWRHEPNAGHFSFLSPFPPAFRVPSFAPANDPEGFDREAFHARYPVEVGDWLDTVLGLRE